MLGHDRRVRVGERLPHVFGGRNVERYPNYKAPRLGGPTLPPVSGYIAHYDPSDLATVTVSNGTVSALADKTGTYSSTSVTGTVWLQQVPNRFNGLPTLFFPFTASHISTNCPASDMTASWFVVGMVYTVTSIFPTLLGPSADAGFQLRVNSSANDLKLAVLSADTAAVGDNDANLVSLGVPFVAGVVSSASDIVIYNNLSGETDAHAITFTAGRTLQIGRASTVAGGANNMAGWIGEIIAYDTTLSAGNATTTIGYLMSKWGIS